MAENNKNKEYSALATIKWVMQIPEFDVVIRDLSEKRTYQSTEIHVTAGLEGFSMTDKVADKFDVIIKGELYTITSPDIVNELHYIKRFLVEYRNKNYHKDENGNYVRNAKPSQIKQAVMDKVAPKHVK